MDIRHPWKVTDDLSQYWSGRRKEEKEEENWKEVGKGSKVWWRRRV